ncbi:MAG: Flp pilus assembly complex ATPase component TadA [Ignavibacteriaceae bacterium]|nr:Flp pilus assembly complex ATPase component TadA [Ignavibacteriaceae bacterium]
MIEETKAAIKKITDAIPLTVMGQDRINYIIEQFKKFTDEDRLLFLKVMNRILTNMIEREASDIEIGGYGNDGFIWMRIFGKKERVKDLPQFTLDEFVVLILNILNENQRRYLIVTRSIDMSYTFIYERKNVPVRFRATVYFDLDSIALNMRAISSAVRSIETMEFHPNVLKVMSHMHVKFGLTLITGITGSGKSSTLDAIIDFHNKLDTAHIVIIASPLEFVHKSNRAIVRHREVGRDVLTFKDGVIQSLRQDPDIIVIGEMRDPDTIMAALEVTDTGHKVFSTLHTSSAVESIDRIIAEVHPNEQDRVRSRLADVLTCVVSQKLVPTINGRVALAKEVLLVNSSVKAAIKNNNTSEIYMMINQGGQVGMQTMEQDLKRLYLQKKISLETAMSFSNNKVRMQQLLTAV